jgi:hypothetical protein
MIQRDDHQYQTLLKALARFSRLFSNSDIAYIDSRFAERLFIVTTGAKDLGREDTSFDALVNNEIGVGIKTFGVSSTPTTSKMEKIAEFTALAREGRFNTRNKQTLVKRVVEARNTRVLSNVREYGINLENCIYHCLIRFPGGAIVHEEPFQLINKDNLAPLNRNGRKVADWSAMGDGVYFTDGLSQYSFNVSKNVLMKRFKFDLTRNSIPLEIDSDPLNLLDKLVGRPQPHQTHIPSSWYSVEIEQNRETAGVDYVVLPLYALKDRRVPEKSGVNQWNASGRKRKFGEAYVSIPSEIHRKHPRFFPPKDQHFDLLLPNGLTAQRAKVCQSGGKALMTQRNVELGRWILGVVDPSLTPLDFEMPPKGKKPYAYSDLLSIGADSVKIRKKIIDEKVQYSIEFARVGAYEEFIGI